MSDEKIVAELRASAVDALSRGFAIMICGVRLKEPWSKYSPHAWKSATRNLTAATQPWTDGEEANYGVSCGPSNLTVVDCDHGLSSVEELKAWMEASGLPDTLIVQSGREGEAGFHLYYMGAVQTCGFTIGNVTGELKGLGGYVVGAGSIHPSGKKYQIINDAPIAMLPEGLVLLAKEKNKTDFPKPGSGELIPISQRWTHLRSRAGSMRNLGLSETGIYNALKDFAENNCEDGANYPDDKIQDLAIWATGADSESPTAITFGSPDPKGDGGVIPEIPIETFVGDALGNLSLAITDGTPIPPTFARGALKALIGAALDGNIGFPGEPTLHMRHWTAIISTRPEAGKSEVWKRILLLLAGKFIEPNGFSVVLPPAGFFSSGEHAMRVLAENDGKKHLAYFDEMRGLFIKAGGTGSTLFDKLLELYENKDGGAGSISNGKASFKDVSLSMLGNFTQSSFDSSVSGKSAAGSGFLSRMTLAFSNGIDYNGDWQEMDAKAVNTATDTIIDRIKWLITRTSEIKAATDKENLEKKDKAPIYPFIPLEDHDAKVARQGFQNWITAEKKRLEKEQEGVAYGQRLESHFKRDLLLRTAFMPLGPGEEPRITKEAVERSVKWVQHELLLRARLWPVDGGTDIVQCERRIMSAIDAQGPLTKPGIIRFSNAAKSTGGFEAWNRAWANLLKADRVVMLPQRSDRGKEKFGKSDAIWIKDKGAWVSDG